MGLTEKLTNLKKALYIPILAGSTLFGSALYNPSYSQIRTTETESFDSSVSKSHIELATDSAGTSYTGKWAIGSQYLEASDFDRQSGHLRYIFNDKLYPVRTTNMKIEVLVNKPTWESDVDRVGIIFTADPISGEAGGTYYVFTINAHPAVSQHNVNISKKSPGFDESYYNDTTTLVRGGDWNKLGIQGDKLLGYKFFINDQELIPTRTDPDTGEIFPVTINLPNLAGYAGVYVFNSDRSISSTTLIDNFRVEYNTTVLALTPAGNGGGADLTPHNPEIMLRGDVTRDKVIDISDVLESVKYIFYPRRSRNQNTCVDAIDVDDNGKLNSNDIVNLLRYIYFGNDPLLIYKIAPPNIGGPGIDLTVDRLRCPIIKQ